MYIDIHCHLDNVHIINDVDNIIERARKAGVKKIVTAGIDPITNRKTLELAAKYDIVEAALGLYPRSALKKEAERHEDYSFDDYNVDEELSFIEKNKKNIVAIGEVGMDGMNGIDKDQQQDFQKIIALAEKLNKPLVVHSRKAEQECFDMLSSSKTKKIVMHCFCGKKKLTKGIVDKGWCLSIPTSVIRAQQFQTTIDLTPITQIFAETDSPYLGPFKQGWNEPELVIESYKKIAELKKMELEEVKNSLWMNWQRLFG